MCLCDKWNKLTNWSNSQFITDNISHTTDTSVTYLESNITDIYGSRKWNTESISELKQLVDIIIQFKSNKILYLPFDQPPGLLLKLLNMPLLRKDLRSVFNINKLIPSYLNSYICVHIRRGDVTPQKNNHLYVHNQFYIDLIDFLLNYTNSNISIAICTQGPIDWISDNFLANGNLNPRLKIFTTKYLMLNDTDIRDFDIMRSSQLIIGANSSFSYLAFLLGNSLSFVDINRHNDSIDRYSLGHQLESAISINPDHHSTSFSNELFKPIIPLLNNLFIN